MPVNVSDIIDINRGLIGPVTPVSPMLDANMLMSEHRVGALAVVDEDGRLVGIISERDVARGLCEHGIAIVDKSVGAMMTSNVISCNPTTDVRDATAMMVQNRICHLPVQDNGRALTVLSIRDIVATRLETLEIDNESLRVQLQEMMSLSRIAS
jgi:CBS domain-containing protein